MSSELFTLYRYLVHNQDKSDESNPYTHALHALESFLNILIELDTWGKDIANYGGLEWDEGTTITDTIIDGYKTALCAIHNNDAVATLTDFATSHVGLEKFGDLIAALQKEKEAEEKARKEDHLGDLDDHPF
jgi:hypothetical protein